MGVLAVIHCRSRGFVVEAICPIGFSWNGHILGYVFLADRLALSGLAALARSSSVPFVPMTLSTPANTPRTSILLLPQPRQSVAPLGTTSPSCKRFPHRLCVAVKFGVCVCECGKVTALKASAYHRLEPPVPRCMDFNRFVLRQWCFGRLLLHV